MLTRAGIAALFSQHQQSTATEHPLLKDHDLSCMKWQSGADNHHELRATKIICCDCTCPLDDREQQPFLQPAGRHLF